MYIIPMAGRGSRFYEKGYTEYKPFLPLKGKTVIECVIENIKAEAPILITREEHKDTARKFSKEIVTVPKLTEGAACTVLTAEAYLYSDEELIIANSDQLVDIDFDMFLNHARKFDGCIMVFPSSEVKWSYAKTDEQGLVIEVAEKKVISPHATVGIYYYKHARDFLIYAQRMIEDNFRVNGEFYVCPVYNWYPRHKKIRIFQIKESEMHGLGTPEDYETYTKRVR